ncbi:leucine-rich repeat extensin-like protein [Gracilaria domingensis]|nr:leucine-rich repeat extensin-like protein [Gracilaria domingensis]
MLPPCRRNIPSKVAFGRTQPHFVRQETLQLWAARETEPQIGTSVQSTVIDLQLLQLRQRQVQNHLFVARAHRVGDLHALERGHVRGGEGDGAETHAVEAQALELGHVAGAAEVEHGVRLDVVGGDGERADSGVAARDEVDEFLLRRGERGDEAQTALPERSRTKPRGMAAAAAAAAAGDRDGERRSWWAWGERMGAGRERAEADVAEANRAVLGRAVSVVSQSRADRITLCVVEWPAPLVGG